MLNFNLQEILDRQTAAIEKMSKPTFPKYNVSEDDGSTTIELGVAGFKAEDFNIDFDNKFLSIFGDAKKEKMEEGVKYLAKNLSMKPFSLRFPTYLFGEVKDVAYSYENGILKVVLAKKEEERINISFVGEK